MQWAELSDDLSTLRLPAAPTKNGKARTKNGKAHIVPLSAPARAILADTPKLSDGPVFSVIGNVPISNFVQYKARLDTLMLMEAVKAWFRRGHHVHRGLATTRFATQRRYRHGQNWYCAACYRSGAESLTGFKSGVAGVYNTYNYENEKRAALDRWGAHVERIVSGADVRNVVPLRR
jgi:hypothetical protein